MAGFMRVLIFLLSFSILKTAVVVQQVAVMVDVRRDAATKRVVQMVREEETTGRHLFVWGRLERNLELLN